MKYKKTDFSEIKNNIVSDIEPESSFTTDININDFDLSDFEYTDIEDIDDKEMKFIESVIRNSYEYKAYIKYLKDELEITHDSFLNIDIQNTPVSLEFHHYPFNLYTIVDAILKHQMAVDTKCNIYTLGEIVMKEHYLGNIGLVPVVTTMHELSHSGGIKIPLSKVYGKYQNFIDKYYDSIRPDAIKAYEDIKNSDINSINESNKAKIKKSVVKYNITYEHDKKD